MRVTQTRIERWLEKGFPKNAEYMAVHRDGFSNEYWPTYHRSKNDLLEKLNKVEDEDMHSIKEVYSYTLDLEPQVKNNRAWNIH